MSSFFVCIHPKAVENTETTKGNTGTSTVLLSKDMEHLELIEQKEDKRRLASCEKYSIMYSISIEKEARLVKILKNIKTEPSSVSV